MNEAQTALANARYAEAAALLSQALQENPRSDAARINLALAQILAGDAPAGAATIQPLAQREPASVQAQYLLGRGLLGTDPVAAVQAFERALKLDPADRTIRFQLGLALERAGRVEEAAAIYEAVHKASRIHATAALKLAQIARQRGDDAQSRRWQAVSERDRQLLGKRGVELETSGFNRYTRPAALPVQISAAADVRVMFELAPQSAWSGAEPDGGATGWVDLDRDGMVELVGFDQQQRFGVWRRTAAGWTFSENTGAAARPSAIVHVAAANYDNDEYIDLVLASEGGVTLLRGLAGGKFDDVTQAAGLAGLTARRATWIDDDHTGFVDLFLARGRDGITVLRNRQDGTFVDDTANMSWGAGAPTHVLDVAAGELNDDDAMDVVLAGEQGAAYLNAGWGEFGSELLPPRPLQQSVAASVDDFNNDGQLDVAALQRDAAGGWAVRFSDAALGVIPVGAGAPRDLAAGDLDNDGLLDVLVLEAGGLRAWRNLGAAGWVEANITELADLHPDARIAPVDADGDRAVDVVVHAPGRAPMVLHNRTTPRGQALALTLAGTISNASALGTRVDARAGTQRVFRQVGQAPLLIGMGNRPEIDALTVIWPTGATDAHSGVTVAGVWMLLEPQIVRGSCPYLYVWDGATMRFVTDVLGAAPLGLSLRRGLVAAADVDEFIELGNDSSVRPQATPQGERIVVEVTCELREILYLDHAELAVVDAPADVVLSATDKLLPPPFPPSELWAISNSIAARRAETESGRDVTAELAELDGRRVSPERLAAAQMRGLAVQSALTLEFGTLDASLPWVLVLDGWLQYGGASVNVGAARSAAYANPFPRLEAQDASGAWAPVDVMVGAPAGKPKRIMVDLAGRLPEGTSALRLSHSLELYWDRILLGQRAALPSVQRVAANAAELRFRGCSWSEKPSFDAPLTPYYDDLLYLPPWRTLIPGWCTRYGDVRELVNSHDDRLVVANCGDAVRLEFDVAALAAPAPGQTRFYYLLLGGWDKDTDHNIRGGNQVGPLPLRGVDDQLYATPDYPDTWPAWAEQTCTRWVPADTKLWFRRAGAGQAVAPLEIEE